MGSPNPLVLEGSREGMGICYINQGLPSWLTGFSLQGSEEGFLFYFNLFYFVLFYFILFLLFRATLAAYESSQAKG